MQKYTDLDVHRHGPLGKTLVVIQSNDAEHHCTSHTAHTSQLLADVIAQHKTTSQVLGYYYSYYKRVEQVNE